MKQALLALFFGILFVNAFALATPTPVHAESAINWDYNNGNVSLGGASGSEGKVKSLAETIINWVVYVALTIALIWLIIALVKLATGNRDALKQVAFALGSAIGIGAVRWLISFLFSLGQNAS